MPMKKILLSFGEVRILPFMNSARVTPITMTVAMRAWTTAPAYALSKNFEIAPTAMPWVAA